MHIESDRPTSAASKVLAALSVAAFWLFPVSPFVAIAAVKSTRGTSGWPRTAALAGAWLSVAAVAAHAVGLLWIVYVVVWNPAIA